MPDQLSAGANRYVPLEDSRAGTPRAHVRRCLCLRRSTCLLLLGTCLYVAWLAAGAAVFSFLEQPVEDRLRRELTERIGQFLEQNECVPGASRGERREREAPEGGGDTTGVRRHQGGGERGQRGEGGA